MTTRYAEPEYIIQREGYSNATITYYDGSRWTGLSKYAAHYHEDNAKSVLAHLQRLSANAAYILTINEVSHTA